MAGSPAHESVDFRPDLGQIVHVKIDAGEAYVGDLIELGQLVEHEISDLFALNFSATLGKERFLNLNCHALDSVAADGALDGCDLNAGQEFLPVKGLSSSVTLNDQQVGGNMLIGCKSLSTVVTAASATNAVASFTGVNYPMGRVSAIRTTHDANRQSWPRYCVGHVREYYI